MSSLAPELRAGLDALQLECTAGQAEQLLAFLELLGKWNRAYNLTGVKDPAQMLRLHILDSLAIAPWLEGERFLDVGTGAGLPGIPLAIVFPERHFTLLDSNGKKVRFLFQVRNQLALENLVEVRCRVEDYQPGVGFDGITSRAFSSLAGMVGGCKHLLGKGGHFYAMKGQYPEQELTELQELRELPKNYKVFASRPLRVPGVTGGRHLIDLVEEPV